MKIRDLPIPWPAAVQDLVADAVEACPERGPALPASLLRPCRPLGRPVCPATCVRCVVARLDGVLGEDTPAESRS